MNRQLICISRHARSARRGSGQPSLNFVTPVTSTPVTSQLHAFPKPRPFSTTLRQMTAQKIDGTAIAKSIRERIGKEIQQKQESNPRYKPSLTIVQGSQAPAH